MPKPRARTAEPSLAKLLDRSSRPIYAVDAARRIIYANPALAAWMGLDVKQIVGRFVEYHSEPAGVDGVPHEASGLLTGLCPPPKSLVGNPTGGTVSCVSLDGRLVHRHAEFVPLAAEINSTSSVTRGRRAAQPGGGVLVLVAEQDLSPQEMAAELSNEPSADELHRAIRRFRRSQAAGYAVVTLLGESAAMRKVRAQVLAAAASGANVLICGRRGTGRSHVARAIHYQAIGDATVKLLPIDCEVVNEDGWRRALDAISQTASGAKHRPTLLLENIESLPPALQAQLRDAIHQRPSEARIVTTCRARLGATDKATNPDSAPQPIDPLLFSELSTIVIDVPPLVERLDDLPILAQYFLEQCNRAEDKQVGSIRPEALDLLALYSWPGELDELREVVAAAHLAATTHEITAADLPPVIHHAAKAAALPLRQPPERVALDELLASIEKEIILRALAQAGGNKTEAAALLGVTRPRLYRRLVQLGLVAETAAEEIVFELESSEAQ